MKAFYLATVASVATVSTAVISIGLFGPHAFASADTKPVPVRDLTLIQEKGIVIAPEDIKPQQGHRFGGGAQGDHDGRRKAGSVVDNTNPTNPTNPPHVGHNFGGPQAHGTSGQQKVSTVELPAPQVRLQK